MPNTAPLNCLHPNICLTYTFIQKWAETFIRDTYIYPKIGFRKLLSETYTIIPKWANAFIQDIYLFILCRAALGVQV